MRSRCVAAVAVAATLAGSCSGDDATSTTTTAPVVAPPEALDASDFRAPGPYPVATATVSGVRRPVEVAAPEGTGPFPVVVLLEARDEGEERTDLLLRHLASWGFVAAAPGRLDDGRQAVELFSAVTFQRGSRFEGLADPERLGLVGPTTAVRALVDDPELDVVVERRPDGLVGPDWRARFAADATLDGEAEADGHLTVAQLRVSLVPAGADAARRGLQPAFVRSAFRGTLVAYERE